MILIADSGSTSTDWCLVNENKLIDQIESPGINPFYQSPDEISNLLSTHLIPLKSSHIQSVYFYGAGCINEEKNNIIKDVLSNHFNSKTIFVESDLLGAARGLCQDKEGIVCILGTGSNSCFYDGSVIVKHVSPLGFIIGDEGSGAVLGKLLVRDVLKNQAPKNIIKEFQETFKLDPSEILNRIYRQPFPNRFLASLTPFLKDHIKDHYIHQLIFDEFRSFIRRNLMQYEETKIYPINFTGSIAFHFSDILIHNLKEEKLITGEIVQDPMDGLIKYHQKQHNNPASL